MVSVLSRCIGCLDRVAAIAVAARLATGVGGGYGLASLAVGLTLSRLPGSRADATATAIMVAILVQLAAVMWAVHAASVVRAALGVAVPAALLLALR